MSNQLPNPFGPEGWTTERLGSLTGKTYLISGANSGVGLEATKILANKGAEVLLLCRSQSKATAAIDGIKKELPDAKVSFIHLDLASQSSIRNASSEILNTVSRIDALICNGAVAQLSKRQTTEEGLEATIGVNHFGHFLLCGLLFEKIEESHGRIVMQGSVAHRMGLKEIQFDNLHFEKNYKAMHAYAQSKLAQMTFAYELQRRLADKQKNSQVQVCHPGFAKTGLGEGDGSWLSRRVNRMLISIMSQSAKKGGWPMVLCATEEGLEPETWYGPTKRFDNVGPIGKSKLIPAALDKEAAAKLWTISEETLDFKFPL